MVRVVIRGLAKTATIPCLVVLVANFALAGPVLTFNPAGGGSAFHFDQGVGWQFNVTAPLAVVGLGWWDETGSGIPLAHPVNLWGPLGNLLASVTVPAGAVAPLDGQFRTVAITPITLAVGNGYVIGGQEFSTDTERLACGSGGICDGTLSITTNPAISFVNGTFGVGGAWPSEPTSFTVAHDGLFGPSFSVAAVPEPTTMSLFSLGIVGVYLFRRRQ
jgi:hypothetical protein